MPFGVILTDLPEVMTVDELAVIIRRSSRTTRQLLASGTLPGLKVAGRWLVEREMLLEALRPRLIQCADCLADVVEHAAGQTPDGLPVCAACASRHAAARSLR